MSVSAYSMGGHTLEVSCEQVEVASMSPRRDPNWRYTDRAGHEHDGLWALLAEVLDNPAEPAFYLDEDGEEYNAPSHLECRLCGEHIEPDMLPPSPYREFIPGTKRYILDGTEVTEDEALRFLNEQR